jgi:hypothetical protein
MKHFGKKRATLKEKTSHERKVDIEWKINFG